MLSHISLTTLALLTSLVTALPPENVEKRQSGELDINVGTSGGSISSDMPLSCVTGCISPLGPYL